LLTSGDTLLDCARTVRRAPAAARACIDKPRSLTDNPRRRFREEMTAVVRCTVDIASFLLQTARFNTRNRTMGKGRIEAFSDGVIAIIITIMVLEIHVPEGFELAALRPVVPVFFAYVLSFVYVGIYWNNHHHMFHLVQKVNGRVLWANLHVLFWLSLLPAVTHWIGNSHLAPWPTALYGAVLVMSATAYTILTRVLLRNHGPDSTLARAVGRDIKGALSVVLYLLGIASAFFMPAVSVALYMLTAAIWLVPDRRVEQVLEQ
jgi:uncharacterized membrane protein